MPGADSALLIGQMWIYKNPELLADIGVMRARQRCRSAESAA